jgi:hypothetical protein
MRHTVHQGTRNMLLAYQFGKRTRPPFARKDGITHICTSAKEDVRGQFLGDGLASPTL